MSGLLLSCHNREETKLGELHTHWSYSVIAGFVKGLYELVESFESWRRMLFPDSGTEPKARFSITAKYCLQY
jgi:hypothetical protein